MEKNSEKQSVDSTNDTSAVEDSSEDSSSKKHPHKHDSGTADLEKVTDFVEEKELASVSGETVSQFVPQGSQEKKTSKDTKVVVRQEDVELLIRELEVGKVTAERKLREHRGNVKETIRAILCL